MFPLRRDRLGAGPGAAFLLLLVLGSGCRPPAGEAPADADSAERRRTIEARFQDARLRGDTDQAIRELEAYLELDPVNRVALRELAVQYQAQAAEERRNGRRDDASDAYLRSADLIRQLRRAYPELTASERQFAALAFYNEACALTIKGDSAAAIDALEAALDSGFLETPRERGRETPRELLLADPDLDATRAAEPDRFQSLVDRFLGPPDGETP